MWKVMNLSFKIIISNTDLTEILAINLVKPGKILSLYEHTNL